MLGGTLGGVVLLEVVLQAGAAVLSASDDARRTPGADGDTTVLCLGACYTLGLGLPVEQSYPAQLEASLRQAHPERDVRVINGGVRGKSIDYFAVQFESLIEAHAPDVVVVNVNRRIGLTELEDDEQQGVFDGLMLPRVVVLALGGASTGPDPLAAALQVTPERRLALAREAVEAQPDDVAAWIELADAYAIQGQYDDAVAAVDRAREVRGTPNRPPDDLRRLNYVLGAGDFAEAQRIISSLQRRAPDLPRRFGQMARARREEVSDPTVDVVLRELLDEGRAALLAGDLPRSRAQYEHALDRDPDTPQAWTHLAYLAWLEGDTVASEAAFTRRHERELSVATRYGLAWSAGDNQLTEAEAAERLRSLLDEHLGRMATEARAAGVSLVVENLSTLPDQQPVLAEVAEQHGVVVVDLQGALERHPDPASLFHGEQHLRLSAAGNAWMAAEIQATLDAHALSESL